MASDAIIGVLAFVTIGFVVAISIVHFGYFLKDPRNRRAVGNVIQDGPSASTQAGIDHSGETTLKERLDSSDASRHPDDPEFHPGRA